MFVESEFVQFLHLRSNLRGFPIALLKHGKIVDNPGIQGLDFYPYFQLSENLEKKSYFFYMEGSLAFVRIYVDASPYFLMIGPISTVQNLSRNELDQIAQKLNISMSDSFEKSAAYIPCMDFESLRKEMEDLYVSVNHHFVDFYISESDIPATFALTEKGDNTAHLRDLSYSFGQKFFYCIQNGDEDALKNLYRNEDIGLLGQVGDDALRQARNLGIVGIYQCSQAALAGGMNAQTAYDICDNYILQIEHCYRVDRVYGVIEKAIYDYVHQMHEIHNTVFKDKIVREVNTYIQNRIYEQISVSDMAEKLGLSQGHLSRHFSKCTGRTISQQINHLKIARAKYLLRYEKYTISETAYMLNYSSQGYFQNVFRKITGMTPKEYLHEEEQLKPLKHS